MGFENEERTVGLKGLFLADVQQEERKRLTSETEELDKLQDELSSLVEP